MAEVKRTASRFAYALRLTTFPSTPPSAGLTASRKVAGDASCAHASGRLCRV